MTSLHNPYPPDDSNIAVQAGMSRKDYMFLFRDILPMRGAQRAVLGQLMQTFLVAVRAADLQPHDLFNEQHVQKILSSITYELPDIT